MTDRAAGLAPLCVFLGLLWYYVWTSNVVGVLLAYLALVGSLMVSYARARAEGVGLEAKDVGWFQRPERIITLGLGLLLADPRPGATYDYAPAGGELLARARRLDEVCRRHGVPLKAAAVQFPLGHPAVAAVLVGCRSRAELAENLRMAETAIPLSLWQELKAEGLLTEEVPTPIDPPLPGPPPPGGREIR